MDGPSAKLTVADGLSGQILEEQEVSRREDERRRRFAEAGHLILSLDQ